MSKKETKQQYSEKFFRKPFPPNHNSLIGSLHDDTLHNVHDALCTLQELTFSGEHDQLTLSENSTAGLFYLMECIIHALRFELYHRE